jgi:hypothetical protein
VSLDDPRSFSEWNTKSDRVPANNWLSGQSLLRYLDDLGMAVSALAAHGHKPGSHEQEMAENARRGIQHRIDYLHDSLRRLLEKSKETR